MFYAYFLIANSTYFCWLKFKQIRILSLNVKFFFSSFLSELKYASVLLFEKIEMNAIEWETSCLLLHTLLYAFISILHQQMVTYSVFGFVISKLFSVSLYSLICSEDIVSNLLCYQCWLNILKYGHFFLFYTWK